MWVTARRTLRDLFVPTPEHHYDWHLGLGVAIIVGVPLVLGVILQRPAEGTVVATFGWLMAATAFIPSLRGRLLQLGLRASIFIGASIIGFLASGHLWATLLVTIGFSLLAPFTIMSIDPLVVSIVAETPPSGAILGPYVVLVVIACMWSGLFLLIPFFGGAYAVSHNPNSAASFLLNVKESHLWTISGLRYGGRLAVCMTVTLMIVSIAGIAHPVWALIGVLTTLQIDAAATYDRAVRRMTGTLVGCFLALTILLFSHDSPLVIALTIAVSAGIAHPMHKFHYAYWPIFSSFAFLLLIDFNTDVISVTDIVERLVNNGLGAVIALAGSFLIWPNRSRKSKISVS